MPKMFYMKNLSTSTLVLTMTLCSYLAICQITVTNSVFPVAGDSLRVTDLGPTANISVDLSAGAEDFFFDLENLPSGPVTVTVFQEASEGMSSADFPTAELVSTVVGLPGETYYDVFNNRIDELGRGNQNFGFGEIDIPLGYSDVPVYAKAPITYNDVFEDNSEGFVSAPKSIIPDSIIGLIPPPFDQFDSIRVSLETNSQTTVDGYGSVSIPGGVYDVLREEVKSTTNTKLFLYAFGSWTEVGSLLLGGLGELGELFGETVTTSYNFISATEKEPILSVTYSDEGVLLSVSYKGSGIISSNTELTYTSAEIKTYPNPTLGDITFDVGAFGPDSYDIAIYNIVGSKVLSLQADITSGSTYSANVDQLRKGTYIYTVHDSAGVKLATKRFIVLKP